jgi:hypothetical protein
VDRFAIEHPLGSNSVPNVVWFKVEGEDDVRRCKYQLCSCSTTVALIWVSCGIGYLYYYWVLFIVMQNSSILSSPIDNTRSATGTTFSLYSSTRTTRMSYQVPSYHRLFSHVCPREPCSFSFGCKRGRMTTVLSPRKTRS